jgi:hypothetical protein
MLGNCFEIERKGRKFLFTYRCLKKFNIIKAWAQVLILGCSVLFSYFSIETLNIHDTIAQNVWPLSDSQIGLLQISPF